MLISCFNGAGFPNKLLVDVACVGRSLLLEPGGGPSPSSAINDKYS